MFFKCLEISSFFVHSAFYLNVWTRTHRKQEHTTPTKLCARAAALWFTPDAQLLFFFRCSHLPLLLNFQKKNFFYIFHFDFRTSPLCSLPACFSAHPSPEGSPQLRCSLFAWLYLSCTPTQDTDNCNIATLLCELEYYSVNWNSFCL